MTAFNKYHGAGNDFIIIDNRNNVFNPENTVLIKKLCDRRFGIGADGLILIEKDPEHDFKMVYFNSDGNESTMCGNGGRCASDFAVRLGIAGKKLSFRAVDGIHKAVYENGIIRLRMNDINETKLIRGNYFLNTGSPHYVIFTSDLDNYDVFNNGRKIRWSNDFKPGGTNVNFVQVEENGIYVRSYERGVEDETLSCGTGVTASAIVSVLAGHFGTSPVNVRTRGGNLSVEFNIMEEGKITNIWLCGPATFVFKGEIDL
jgi:diaminopimelate epimerase